MHPPGPVTRRVLREVLLTGAAVLGLLCLLAALASVTLGVKPLIFRSGSMQPTIATGALGLARTTPAAELRTGDVVSVLNASGTRITHRVVSVEYSAPTAVLVLKGDDNDVPDAETYVVAEADRVFFHLDGAGYVLSALSSPYAVFGGGVLVGVLLMYAFQGRRAERVGPPPDPSAAPAPVEEPEPTEPNRARPGSRVLALVPLAGLLGAMLAPAADTRAAFTDTGTATTGTFSTVVPSSAPTLSCRVTLTQGSVRVGWTAVSGARGYVVTVQPNGRAAVSTNYGADTLQHDHRAVSNPESGTVTVRARYDPGSATPWVSGPSNAVTYTVSWGGNQNLQCR